MTRASLMRIMCCMALSTMAAAGPARAGGIMLYQYGTPDVGTSAAGYAARAQDASTVFTNPAGMSRLDRSQVLLGMQALYGDLEFGLEPGTTFSGNSGNAVGLVPAGSAFIAHKVNRDVSLGFGFLSYFGLGQSFNNGWAGRYYIQESTLMGISFMPAASYRVNDRLSLGAGLNVMYGYMEGKNAVNNIPESMPDGQMKYKDDAWGLGANLGILVEPRAGTRFGLNYLSEVKLDFSDVPEFSGLGPLLELWLTNQGLTSGSIDLGITVPQMVMFSVYQEIGEKWAVLGNVGWQDWSRFGKVDVGVDTGNPASLTTASIFKDTWHVALGAQYRYSKTWMFSSGVSYDSSAIDDGNRSVTLPIGEIFGVALGARYALNANTTLGAAYQFAVFGDMPVDQERGPLAGRVTGDFKDTTFQFLALNLTWAY